MIDLSIRRLSLGLTLTAVLCSGLLSAGLSYSAANEAVRSTRESGDNGVDSAFAIGSESTMNLTLQLFQSITGHVEERVHGYLGVPVTAISALLRRMSLIHPDQVLSAEWRKDHIEDQITQTFMAVARSGVSTISWGTPFGAPNTQFFRTVETPPSRRAAEPIESGGFYLHAQVRNDGTIGNEACWQSGEAASSLYRKLRGAGMWEHVKCQKGADVSLVDTSGRVRAGPCRDQLMRLAGFGDMSPAEWREKAHAVNAAEAEDCSDILRDTAVCTHEGLCDCKDAVQLYPCGSNQTLMSPGGPAYEHRLVSQLCPHTCGTCAETEGPPGDPDGFGTCRSWNVSYWSPSTLILMMPGLWNTTLQPGVPHYCGLPREDFHPTFVIGGTFVHPDQPEHPLMGRRVGSVHAEADLEWLSVFVRGIPLPSEDSRIAIVERIAPPRPGLQTHKEGEEWLLVAASHGAVSRPRSEMGGRQSPGFTVISVFLSDDPILVAGARHLRDHHMGEAEHHCIVEHEEPLLASPGDGVFDICGARITTPRLAQLQWLLIVMIPRASVMGAIVTATQQTRARIREDSTRTAQDLDRHWLAVGGILTGCTAALMVMAALLVVAMTKPLSDLTRHMSRFGRVRMKQAAAAAVPSDVERSMGASEVSLAAVSLPVTAFTTQSVQSSTATEAPPPLGQVSCLREIACLQRTFAELRVSLDHAQSVRDTALREQLQLQLQAEVQSQVEEQLREELGLEQQRKLAAERRRTEAAALAHEAALRAEAQSVTSKYLAHEVRNNLMPISKVVTTRTADEQDWTVASQALELIHESLQRSLDLGKLRCGLYKVSPTTFDVAAQVRLVAKLVSSRARPGVLVEVATETPAELWVHTDAYLIHTMLINLASNAVKYTYQGAVILGCHHHGELVITVTDTGRGIEVDKANYIFSEYRACRQQHGTGLGLPLCKSIADTVHGNLAFFGREGGGTVFRAVIPCRRSTDLPPRPELDAGDSSQAFPSTCIVLIVDDDAVCQKVIKHRIAQALGEEGRDWVYETCASGEGALSLMLTPSREAVSERGSLFDIVVMDEHMPQGGGEMLGTEAVRILRDGGFTGAIIGCSGNTIAQDHRNAGADESWSKPPPPPQAVRAQLARALAQARKRRFGSALGASPGPDGTLGANPGPGGTLGARPDSDWRPSVSPQLQHSAPSAVPLVQLVLDLDQADG
eukprot:TRINITY_DN14815_c0_g1_i1.p1 TRINITY_DN14815_c0_g1~~TRINITY_DN14815_c0_g1_i1.p1  ORF type:complete len:1227 (+),score=241.78 TRINITY_DN14815_c0_g1_i1:81-3683(+)